MVRTVKGHLPQVMHIPITVLARDIALQADMAEQVTMASLVHMAEMGLP